MWALWGLLVSHLSSFLHLYISLSTKAAWKDSEVGKCIQRHYPGDSFRPSPWACLSLILSHVLSTQTCLSDASEPDKRLTGLLWALAGELFVRMWVKARNGGANKWSHFQSNLARWVHSVLRETVLQLNRLCPNWVLMASSLLSEVLCERILVVHNKLSGAKWIMGRYVIFLLCEWESFVGPYILKELRWSGSFVRLFVHVVLSVVHGEIVCLWISVDRFMCRVIDGCALDYCS